MMCVSKLKCVFKTRLDEPKTTTFITTFESSADGIKSTSKKVTQSENVVVEEVLSEPEQEKEANTSNVEIEEVEDDEGKFYTLHIYTNFSILQ